MATTSSRTKEEPLLLRARATVADARRAVAQAADQRRGSARPGRPRLDRRSVLLAKSDLSSLIDALRAARTEIDREMKARTRHKAAISAYSQCGRAGRQYARDMHRKPTSME